MGGWYAPQSHLRFQVTPKEAEVYVDGYYAGRVDEFDGTFQRLHVTPGQHEIVVFLDGYRSLRQHLYLSVNATRTIEGELVRLAPGEPEERRPEPADDRSATQPEDPNTPPQSGPAPPQTRQPPPPVRLPPPPSSAANPLGAGSTGPGTGERTTLATLVIAVSPSGSKVLVDGQEFEGPQGKERLIVQVAEGRHRIEVSRRRYESESIEVEVRAGETRPVSFALRRP